ncbi:hypothetical protein BEWA_039610 [Theileria equi strain WA]|uniref:Uncharacterized protein n=1 Tax=Theileria equi strain WA TaxID=1537102 RepID=L1LFJ2_THEEQ|nr:hypothetical protein BEWA_039610 [Theileria equi strain WA]EKX73923.1 hypothetical protein BEWA_039610 [Theileria equi strain WA]|eukprot:XP_004833375.1 hypothetical protein BEWA_039610 [Theileria equi strain WA]
MVVSIQQKERVKKAAFFFAGLGHLQPMLLVATNSDYLLDRFLLERRCSSEYVSRTITSLIFIEILATILVAGFAVLLGLYKFIPEGKNEEDFRGYLTVGIQWIIFIGYLQILKAFTSGGEKGHIQWFYFSLLFQHFFTCIIGAGIGFIDVDRALWYFMTLPMSPVLIFFYQMLIHMWAQKSGLVDIGYTVVKNQIWLGLVNSFLATLLWIIAYFPGLYNSQPIPDVVEIKIELDRTYSYDCTISGPNNAYMLVGSSNNPPGYTCYRHKPDTSGHFKGRKFIVTSICQGESPIKKVSFPEHEFCTHAEVYRSNDKKWLLVKLLMEDGSAYYYCPRKNGTENEWCVYKVSKKDIGNLNELGELLQQIKSYNSNTGLKDSGELQNKLIKKFTPGSSAVKTESSDGKIKLNLQNTRSYVCTSGTNGTKKDVPITVISVELTGTLENYYCHVHTPCSKTLELSRDHVGAGNILSITLQDPPSGKKVDHTQLYRDPRGQPILLVVVTTDGEKWYYGPHGRPGFRSSPQTWVGAKLDEDRYITEGDLENLLTKACKGFEQNCFQKNLNQDGGPYSFSKNGFGNDTTVHDPSNKHTVCLDLKNICEYWSTYKSGSNKTLISVEEKTELQICSEYTKFLHKMDSGSKFCIDKIQHTPSSNCINAKTLDLRPCIDGLVDEVSVYYGTTSSKVDIDNPLLICIKKSKYDSSNSKNEDSYCYYCKGFENCWYRYRYGTEPGKNCVQIPAESEDDKCTDKGLCKLLSELSTGTINQRFTDMSRDTYLRNLSSDHDNYDYRRVLWDPITGHLSGTCMPLIMHGLAVGAMGSIYPHLVPKTLVSAKHGGTFNVISMFLAALPQVLNLIFLETKSKAFANRPWEGGDKWYLFWLLYIPYLLSFLLIIFNIHYPGWRICCYIRSHTLLAFLIMLSVSFTNDLFLAVGRGGIMDQRSGNKRLGGDGLGLKNDHSLINKIAPFMALSYIPFWLTTSPMIKSYAHSVDQYFFDKDRDSWPTSCCGFLSSWGYWCKCGCRGLYTSLPKLLTFDMRAKLAHRDDRLFILVTSDLPKEEWFTDW